MFFDVSTILNSLSQYSFERKEGLEYSFLIPLEEENWHDL